MEEVQSMTIRIRMSPLAGAFIEEAAERLQERIVEEVADDARRLAPVDTGELRASIRASKGRVTASAPHSAYVELGTRHNDAQPFLKPALYRKRGG